MTLKAPLQTEKSGKREAEEERIKLLRKTAFPLKIFLAGLALRGIFLASFYSWIPSLQNRIELATPVTSLKTVKEGVFLYKNGISPYEGGLYRQSPLYLTLFSSIFEWNELAMYIAFILMDIFAAYLIWRIGAKYLPRAYSYSVTDITFEVFNASSSNLSDSKIEKVSPTTPRKQQLSYEPWLLPAIYLFNPYSIFACFSLSTYIFNHLSILLAILFAVDQNIILLTFFLSLATHLSLYPLTLFIPLYLIALPKENSRTMLSLIGSFVIYFGWFALFTFAASTVTGSFQFLDSLYGTLLLFKDLTPNVGLFWYFFIEMFRQFRTYFLAAFQFIHLVPVFPLSYRFSDHPMLVLLLQLGIACIYKPYTSVADAALYMSFLPIVSGFSTHMSKTTFVAALLIASTALGPVVWNAWIVVRTANANFIYIVTILYTLAHTLLLVDIIQAYRKFEFLLRHPSLEKKSLKLI